MSEINGVELRSCLSRQLAAFAWQGRRKWVLVSVLVLLAFGLYFQSTIRQLLIVQQINPTEKIQIHLGGFSPDNRMIVYDFCRAENCYAGLLDLQTGAVMKIVPPNSDEWWSSGSFSPSGKYLAFAVKRKSENSRWSQLGLFDLATGSLKMVTQSKALKEFPSFSHEEKQLIYAQANRERESGKTRFSDWDIYELDIESGQERRLTNYEFSLIGRPFYLADGKQFIFSGEAPSRFLGKVGAEAYHAYEDIYKENTIFIFGKKAKDTELQPAFVNGPYTCSPRISKDGQRIIYMGRSDELNRLAGQKTLGFAYDIFMLEGGQHRRLTNLGSSLSSYTMSLDGSLVAYISNLERKDNIQLWILDVNRNQSKQLEISLNVFPSTTN